ncbi:MAG: MarR family winged helix-turn-helix transcriptional regulator [Parvibaculaceae bacterium]
MCIWGNFFNLLILPKLERDFDILRDDFNILLCLAGAGKLTGTEICRIVGRPRNSISRCADRLLRRKLIRSQSVSEDKRQTIFEITPEGRRLYRAMLPHMVTLEEKMLAALDERERDVLDGMLAKLIGELGTLEPVT